MGTMTFGTSAPGSLVALLQGQPLVISRRNQPATFHFPLVGQRTCRTTGASTPSDWSASGCGMSLHTADGSDNQLSNFDLDTQAFRVASRRSAHQCGDRLAERRAALVL
jgi:hypothetical protein